MFDTASVLVESRLVAMSYHKQGRNFSKDTRLSN